MYLEQVDLKDANGRFSNNNNMIRANKHPEISIENELLVFECDVNVPSLAMATQSIFVC